MPPPRVQLVTDVAALQRVVASLQGATRLALDTEGNGMHAYAGRLSVIQLCIAADDAPTDDVFVIDPLAMDAARLATLAPLLGPDGPAKIVHDLGFDARMLVRAGLPLGHVIDTSVHARFLGLRETGLGSLLRARHELVLTKELQQHDWAKRPLGEAELTYLAADVAYLGPLAAGLAREADALGIADEIDEETRYGLAQALADDPPEPAWSRVHGALRLLPVERAVLRELFLLREREAAAVDIPSGRVLSADALVRIAHERPVTVPQLRRTAHLGERAGMVIDEVLAAIRRGEEAGDVPAADRALLAARTPSPERHELTAWRAREKALSTWRRAEATARGVDVQVVLPGHALTDLSRTRPRSSEDLAAIAGLGAGRIARYATALLALYDALESGSAGS